MTPRALVPTLLVLVGLLLTACSAGEPDAHPVPRSPGPSTTLQAAESRLHEAPAVLVLREWDRRRAAAYESGSLRALRCLYVAGSAAGRADARLLRAYAERGLVVRGMRTQVLRLDVLRARRSLLRLRVTDRLVGAQVRRRSGLTLPLPRDSPTTRLVTLRLVAGQWRVASVRQGGGEL